MFTAERPHSSSSASPISASVAVLRGASHHSLPTEQPAELNRLLTHFLA
ncbi:hypothetical protein [Streptomyces sulfonofaciens]|nr:hypothetical protein [Streptomyces sulfonofaciens]